MVSKLRILGNSLVVEWLGLHVLLMRVQVQFLVGDLRAPKLHGIHVWPKNEISNNREIFCVRTKSSSEKVLEVTKKIE